MLIPIISFSKTLGEELRRSFTSDQSKDNVNALAKALYSRLFAWIVNGINQMVSPLPENQEDKLSIGILDIFGFEHLQTNTFEQVSNENFLSKLQFL